MRRAVPWPPLFDALAASPRCLTGLLRLRAAAADPEARVLYASFEQRLCRGLGEQAVQWPTTFATFVSRPPHARESVRSLPRLAPEQSLMLLGPLHHLCGASADLYASALETSFGEDSTWPLPDEEMVRLLGAHVPSSWARAWCGGLGLEPPSVWKPPARGAVERALSSLAGGDSLPAGLLDARAAAELVFTHTTLAVALELERHQATPHAA